jgi:hypothetical protein
VYVSGPKGTAAASMAIPSVAGIESLIARVG